jgi:hypothetical protein
MREDDAMHFCPIKLDQLCRYAPPLWTSGGQDS